LWYHIGTTLKGAYFGGGKPFLPYIASIPSGGTFVPHFQQKSPHAFSLKNKQLPVKKRAASPQPFMFQYWQY
jgi:hypothetical protein